MHLDELLGVVPAHADFFDAEAALFVKAYIVGGAVEDNLVDSV